MNPERPDDPRELMEVRITAMVLGEASAFEEAELRDAIAGDPELKAYHEEMLRTVGVIDEVVRTGASDGGTDRLVLDEKRRGKLQRLFGRPANRSAASSSDDRRAGNRVSARQILQIAAVVAALGIVGSMFLPALSKSKAKAGFVERRQLEEREMQRRLYAAGHGATDEPFYGDHVFDSHVPAQLEAFQSASVEAPHSGLSPRSETATIFLPEQSAPQNEADAVSRDVAGAENFFAGVADGWSFDSGLVNDELSARGESTAWFEDSSTLDFAEGIPVESVNDSYGAVLSQRFEADEAPVAVDRISGRAAVALNDSEQLRRQSRGRATGGSGGGGAGAVKNTSLSLGRDVSFGVEQEMHEQALPLGDDVVELTPSSYAFSLPVIEDRFANAPRPSIAEEGVAYSGGRGDAPSLQVQSRGIEKFVEPSEPSVPTYAGALFDSLATEPTAGRESNVRMRKAAPRREPTYDSSADSAEGRPSTPVPMSAPTGSVVASEIRDFSAGAVVTAETSLGQRPDNELSRLYFQQSVDSLGLEELKDVDDFTRGFEQAEVQQLASTRVEESALGTNTAGYDILALGEVRGGERQMADKVALGKPVTVQATRYGRAADEARASTSVNGLDVANKESEVEELRQNVAEFDVTLSAAAAKANGADLGVDADALFEAPVVPPLVARPEVQTKDEAFSTFSMNVSDVSFKLAKASLENAVLPDGSRLRSEEFINAFDYHDPAPTGGQKIAFHWERARSPFAFDRDLLRFSVQTAAAGRESGQPLNIVVLLDNSGSMVRADRVEITQRMLAVLASQMGPADRISVVSFARTSSLWVDGMAGGDPGLLLGRVGRLNPEGGTNLEEALESAYEIARKHYDRAANNRVVLLTDGAANLGDVEPEALRRKVVEQRRRGIALDCFGVGWEGYNDNLLETLSRNGDGRYGFIDDPSEVESEFADLLVGALQVAAADLKAQVEFNPERVTSYRQVGYIQHQLTKEQFRDNTVDAAEIGAAEAGNALYVTQIDEDGSGPIGWVRVRHRVPSTGQYEEKKWVLPYAGSSTALESSDPAMRLAAVSAAFAEWLAQSPHAAEVTPGELQNLLNGVPEAFAPDTRPLELQRMIQAARSLAGQ